MAQRKKRSLKKAKRIVAKAITKKGVRRKKRLTVKIRQDITSYLSQHPGTGTETLRKHVKIGYYRLLAALKTMERTGDVVALGTGRKRWHLAPKKGMKLTHLGTPSGHLALKEKRAVAKQVDEEDGVKKLAGRINILAVQLQGASQELNTLLLKREELREKILILLNK